MVLHLLFTVVLLAVAGFCWWRTRSEASFRVITHPTPAEKRSYWATNAAGLVLAAGVLFLLAPPFSPTQPEDGFLIDGRLLLWLLPGLFALLAGGGLIALALSIAVLGGMVSRTDKKAPRGPIAARAGQAAEGWARKNPRGMVVAMTAFLVVAMACMAMSLERRVVGTPEHVSLGGFMQAAPEQVPWSRVQEVVLERTTDDKGKRKAIVRFALDGGRVEELESTGAWRIPDELLERIASFCAAHGVAVSSR